MTTSSGKVRELIRQFVFNTFEEYEIPEILKRFNLEDNPKSLRTIPNG